MCDTGLRVCLEWEVLRARDHLSFCVSVYVYVRLPQLVAMCPELW